MKFTILLLFMSGFANAKSLSDVYWFKDLRAAKVRSFNVCGSADIKMTPKSFSNHFTLGPKNLGYVFTDLLPKDKYFEILASKNFADSKTALEAEMKKAHLWVFGAGQGFTDLGPAVSIGFPFTASIKDCMDGAKTTLGMDCSRFDRSGRRSCCGEKFPGPVVYWGASKQYRLMYSPDPGVRLKIPGEKGHRYCDVQEKVEI